jgi:hypothetical protein
MEINSEIRHSYSHNSIKCGICRAEIRRDAIIFQEGLHYGIVCSKCHDSTSKEDLELMANMFLAYGGYFGKLKDPDFSIGEILKELLKENDVNTKNASLEDLNVRLLHCALLHGLTPQQFIRGLEILIK